MNIRRLKGEYTDNKKIVRLRYNRLHHFDQAVHHFPDNIDLALLNSHCSIEFKISMSKILLSK